MADDRQPEPEPAVAPARAAPSADGTARTRTAETRAAMPDAGVGDAHLDVRARPREPQPRRGPPSRRELDRVREQVPHHLLQAVRVAGDRRRVRFDAPSQTGCSSPPARAASPRSRRARRRARFTGRMSSRSLPRDRRARRRADRRSGASARAAFRSIVATARGALLAADLAGRQQPRPAVDRRQRRAQLVRHRHQELVLDVARFLALLPRALLARQRRSSRSLVSRRVCRGLRSSVHLPEQHQTRSGRA